MKCCILKRAFAGAEAGTGTAKKRRVGRQAVRPQLLNRKFLSLALAVVLLVMRVGRAAGQEENQVGYRHEFYREDHNRMSIDTDSVLFDVGLGTHLRAQGSYVIDTISGATPNGAPPQAQWPFATYGDFYQRDYTQAYMSQFNQFVGQNQIYVDAGYETYTEMTNQAAQFAAQTAPTIATNSADASYQSLTNNPNYRNHSVPLSEMHDRREAYSLSLPFQWGIHQITPTFAHSRESDYKSISGALTYALSLKEKNTTLYFGYAHDADSVRDDKFIWEGKDTDNFLVGVNQLLSPQSYATFNFTFNNESGYLSDPYRGVMVQSNYLQLNPGDPALLPEVRPRHRSSEIAYVSYTQFVDPLDGSVEASYRFFHDSWGIFSHTVELDWHQKLNRHMVLTPMFRYTWQSAADFYYVLVPDYLNLPTYYSADYRLSELNTFTCGITFTWRIVKFMSLDASYYRYVMQGLDGVTSQSAYPSANIFSVGLRIWF